MSGRQGDVFFGDVVEKCGMITLEAGNKPAGEAEAFFKEQSDIIFEEMLGDQAGKLRFPQQLEYPRHFGVFSIARSMEHCLTLLLMGGERIRREHPCQKVFSKRL